MPFVLLNKISCFAALRIGKIISCVKHCDVFESLIKRYCILGCLDCCETDCAEGLVCGIAINSTENRGHIRKIFTDDRANIASYVGDKSFKESRIKVCGHAAVVTVSFTLHPPEALNDRSISISLELCNSFIDGRNKSIVKIADLITLKGYLGMSSNIRGRCPRFYVIIRSSFCCGKLSITTRIFNYDVLLPALAERCCDSDLRTGIRRILSESKGNGNEARGIVSKSFSVI